MQNRTSRRWILLLAIAAVGCSGTVRQSQHASSATAPVLEPVEEESESFVPPDQDSFCDESRIVRQLSAELDLALSGSDSRDAVIRVMRNLPKNHDQAIDEFAQIAGCRLGQYEWLTGGSWIPEFVHSGPFYGGTATYFVGSYDSMCAVIKHIGTLQGADADKAREYFSAPRVCVENWERDRTQRLGDRACLEERAVGQAPPN